MTLEDRARACIQALIGRGKLEYPRRAVNDPQNSHAQVLRVACLLVQGYELGDGAAMGLLVEFCGQSDLPWEPRELEHKIREANRLPSKQGRGYMLTGGRQGGASSSAERAASAMPPAPRDARARAEWAKIDEKAVESFTAGMPECDFAWFRRRSPVAVEGLDSGAFLDALFEAGERVVIFTRYYSQGDFLWVAGGSQEGRKAGTEKPWPAVFEGAMIEKGTATVSVDVKRQGWVPVSGDTYYCLRWVCEWLGYGEEVTLEQWKEMDALQNHIFALRKGGASATASRPRLRGGFRLSDERGVQAKASELPARGRMGAWYLVQPVSGQWEIGTVGSNGKGAKYTRRSEGNVTAWRHLVLESDDLPAEKWSQVVAALQLPIAAIYTSAGRSIHALVRYPVGTKAEWDGVKQQIERIVCPLGADPGALSAVRLSRLPGVLRDGTEVAGTSGGKVYRPYPKPRLQELVYLNPRPAWEPIVTMREVRG